LIFSVQGSRSKNYEKNQKFSNKLFFSITSNGNVECRIHHLGKLFSANSRNIFAECSKKMEKIFVEKTFSLHKVFCEHVECSFENPAQNSSKSGQKKFPRCPKLIPKKMTEEFEKKMFLELFLRRRRMQF